MKKGFLLSGGPGLSADKPQTQEANGSAAAGTAVKGILIKGCSMENVEIPASVLPVSAANGWHKCKVPHLMGIPLMIRQWQAYKPEDFTDNQVATRLMIEPDSGFAPPQWLGGPHNMLGRVMVARTDGKPFTIVPCA
ncbi:unnamed protein product [Vitrella brassicaformis CCMP3155]|uniref:Uncharacterized protein n=1 Tax=Vitrella brassicaformis (strain CCMP3155) TaxID=1169540 RepID=A0A0G4EBD7_VITBC|nr:unnamed protein product [Vitrella brassicaformis CCMP3155]|eukprot:CEL92577.1 unnamed protein product [Vitrella brassicaformis CCMP3155]